MTSQTLQTICQIIIVIGFFITAIGGLGSYIFGQKAQREKEAVQEQKVSEGAAQKAHVGRLQKEPKILLSANQQLYPKLELGDSGSILIYTGQQGTPLFKIAEDNNITIIVEDGQIKVSTKIRDQNGQIIAEIIKNEWKVNPNNSWDRNYSKNALEVCDLTGDVILQVKLVEDRVQFQAKLYDASGRRIGFGKITGPKPKGTGGGIEITGPDHTKLTLKIEPIFKYPSELHLGEFVESQDHT